VLAGRMKLSHFLVLAVIVGGLAVFGLSRACSGGDDDEIKSPTTLASPSTATPSSTPTPAPTPTALPATSPTTPSDLAARSYDNEVIAWSRRSISGDKMKDATKGKSYKLNLYKDAGKTTVNRAKIDLDRDDKFDEKYTFDATKITLQVAPNDDESYTQTYHWNGSGWTKE
jgi:hypothetical protein